MPAGPKRPPRRRAPRGGSVPADPASDRGDRPPDPTPPAGPTQLIRTGHALPGPVVIGGALLTLTEILVDNTALVVSPIQMGGLALLYGWAGARIYSLAGDWFGRRTIERQQSRG